MGYIGLKEAEMGEAIDANIRGQQGLNGTADAHKKSKFVNRVVLENQHKASQPDQDTANM